MLKQFFLPKSAQRAAQIMAALDFNKCFIILYVVASFYYAYFQLKLANRVHILEVPFVLRFAYFDLDSSSDPHVLQFAWSEHSSVHFEKHPCSYYLAISTLWPITLWPNTVDMKVNGHKAPKHPVYHLTHPICYIRGDSSLKPAPNSYTVAAKHYKGLNNCSLGGLCGRLLS